MSPGRALLPAPQLCPLALGCGHPLEVGEGCLGGGWSPGSTECLSLEGPPVQPCGSPSSLLGLALPQDGGLETPSTTPARASRGLDWLLTVKSCFLCSTENQGHFQQPHADPLRHTRPQSCRVLCGGGPAGSGHFPVPAELQPFVMVVFHLRLVYSQGFLESSIASALGETSSGTEVCPWVTRSRFMGGVLFPSVRLLP